MLRWAAQGAGSHQLGVLKEGADVALRDGVQWETLVESGRLDRVVMLGVFSDISFFLESFL